MTETAGARIRAQFPDFVLDSHQDHGDDTVNGHPQPPLQPLDQRLDPFHILGQLLGQFGRGGFRRHAGEQATGGLRVENQREARVVDEAFRIAQRPPQAHVGRLQ